MTLCLIGMLLSATSSFAYKVFDVKTGNITESNKIPSPTREIEQIESMYKVTYSFDSLLVYEDPEVTGTSFFRIPGFSLSERAGYASTPLKFEQFTLDSQTEYEVTVSKTQYKDYSFVYTPGRTPVANNSNSTPIPDAIVEKDSFSPENPVVKESTSFYRGHSILNMRLNPIMYNSEQKKVRIYNKIVLYISPVEIDATSLPLSPCNITGDDYFWSNSITHLSESAKIVKPLKELYVAANRHYLILTSPAFIKPVNSFAGAKRKDGYSVEIISHDNWTSDMIHQEISNSIVRNKNLYYVLLVGDTTIMPSNTSRFAHKYDNRHFVSDFAYSCLDGENDFVPDVCLGRIPVSSTAEATNILNKIISYSKYSFSDNSSKAMFASYFQDDNRDGIEDRGFVCNTEKVADYLSSQFSDVSRIYYASGYVNPSKWSYVYGTGEMIPDFLRRPGFAWNGNKSDIISAFNSGCNFIVHRDHGAISGWSSPSFTINDMSQLDNKTYPIVFSVNCLTGKFTESNNFARKLLSLKNAGCASILASQEVSWTNRNDAYLIGMIDAAWPNHGLEYTTALHSNWNENTNEPVESIGDMARAGLARVSEVFGNPMNDIYTANHFEEYQILGDPSLDIYFDSSVNLSDIADITKDSDGYSVTSSKEVNISFFNSTTGETRRYRGIAANFNCNATDSVYIAVSRHGCQTFRRSNLNAASKPGGETDDSYFSSIKVTGNTFTIKLSNKIDDIIKNSLNDVKIVLSNPYSSFTLEINVVPGNYIYTTNGPHYSSNQKGNVEIISLLCNTKLLESKKITY